MSDSTFEEEHNAVVQSPAPSDLHDSNNAPDSSTNSDEKIVERADNRAVKCSKIAVLTVISLAALAFGTVTYFFTDNEEEDDFELQYVFSVVNVIRSSCISNKSFALKFHDRFKDFSQEIATLAHIEAENAFGLLESMSLTITSYALDTNVSWPFLTVPHFEKRGEKNNDLSKALHLSVVPLLEEELKEKWEDYASLNQDWIQEGVNASPELHVDFLGVNLKVNPIPSRLFRFKTEIGGETVPQDDPGVDFGPAAYAPVWQQSPAPHDPSIVNYDLLSHPLFARIYRGMWDTGLPVLSEVSEFDFLYGGSIKDDITHPHSALMHPIFSSVDEDEKGNRGTLLGMLVAILPWDSYFQNLIPSKIRGIVVVLHNTCGEHFTYRLDGPEAIYIGT